MRTAWRPGSAALVAIGLLAGGCQQSDGTEMSIEMGASPADLSEAAPRIHEVTVSRPSHRFDPADLTIRVNDIVRWTWAASNHNVVSGTQGVADGKFCSPNNTGCGQAPFLQIGTTYERKFTTPGDFPYFCLPHFGVGMVGTIRVRAE